MTKIKVLRSAPARLKGMLFSKPSDDMVLLVPCNDVHTYGMSYPLDIAFVDRNAHVIQTYRNVAPKCRIRCPRATAVLERAARSEIQWYSVGRYAGPGVHSAIKKTKRKVKV